MGILSTKREGEMSDDDVAALVKNHAPAEIKAFLAKGHHKTLEAQAVFYGRVATAANEQARALLAVRRLNLSREAEGSVFEQELEALRQERDALAGQIENMRTALMRATASPALAVHSDD